MLQIFFTVSYVLLAPFVGAFADALQKRHVMFVSNALKASGCLLMIAGVHPMIAYGVVGFGAAAYSPAKYGILTELLPADRLVAANAWLESATVLSTIVGTMVQSSGPRMELSGFTACGNRSLMNMTPWPTNTPSPIVTPEQMNEWLEILQFLPMVASDWISTNAPIFVLSPIVQP